MGSKRLNHVRKQTNENSSAGPIIERKYTLKPTASSHAAPEKSAPSPGVSALNAAPKVVLWDTENKGFGLRARRGGAKTCILHYRARGLADMVRRGRPRPRELRPNDCRGWLRRSAIWLRPERQSVAR